MPDHPDERLHFEEPSYEAIVPFIEEAFATTGKPLLSRADIVDIMRKHPDVFVPLIALMQRDVMDFRPNDATRIERATMLVAVEWASWANLRRHGQKTFVFSSALTQLLMHTDFRVPCSAINLPFPCVFYRWMDADLVIANPDGTAHRVQGVYVFLEADGPDLVLTSYVVTRDPQTPITNALYFSINWVDPTRVLTPDDILRMGVPASLVPLANLIINSTLYLSSPEAETRRAVSPHRALDAKKTQHPKKMRRLAKQRAATTGADYIYVGASVSVPTDGTGARLTVHHWVRGHWKMQTHGTQRAERKPLWIKPYERGKDLAEQVKKRYRAT